MAVVWCTIQQVLQNERPRIVLLNEHKLYQSVTLEKRDYWAVKVPPDILFYTLIACWSKLAAATIADRCGSSSAAPLVAQSPQLPQRVQPPSFKAGCWWRLPPSYACCWQHLCKQDHPPATGTEVNVNFVMRTSCVPCPRTRVRMDSINFLFVWLGCESNQSTTLQPLMPSMMTS